MRKRSRILLTGILSLPITHPIVRAGVGRAFAAQGNGMRVGFGAINKDSTSVDGVSTKTIISGVRQFAAQTKNRSLTISINMPFRQQESPLRSNG